ncbi:hypothetical protein FNZ56_09435 [Pseudoluteimonas lycopersici]|uniref:Exo-alpha-sialidase n=1 Tax=Pseudoluteimonas lycopersici TaxID=1324796 RepID=A0A516V6C3_9GAMM|nr:hypothetical protein [Lysobacter lycopersici]QDQ74086.1 hypothetical protein FNZ56_09435 [Lysobacter lycopersici]
MSRMLGKWSRAALCATVLAGLILGLAGNVVAATVSLEGTQTPLKGNAERIISLRHQEHMWEAANGETYVIINRGTQGNLDSLQVFSTPDRGLSWYPGPRLPGSDRNSISDGYLDGKILYVTYSTPAGAVMFTALQRQGATAVATWKTIWSDTAFSSPGTIAINPAMAVDAGGTIWLAFVGQDVATGNYSIRMLRNTSQAEGWVDTGFTFGAVDNLSIERSARPVATATGVGMVYAVHNQVFWASRENAWPQNQAWARQLLFTSQSGDTDPYASHFSVAADDQHDIHMSLSDGGRVRYFRFDAATKAWSAKWLTGNISAGYLQTSIVAGDVVVASNNYSNVVVLRSTDNGASFTTPYMLVHPAPGNGVSYPYPRVETASRTAGPMLLLQQYVDNSQQRLLLFNVPLP